MDMRIVCVGIKTGNLEFDRILLAYLLFPVPVFFFVGRKSTVFKIHVTTLTSHEINLNGLSISEWPDEAKKIARDIISVPRFRNAFLAQLPELRKSWLIAKIEAQQNLELELSEGV